MKGKPSTIMRASPQFKCYFCGKGFEQRSKFQRHIETAHPPSAPSAADLERVLKGIRYPRTKEELANFAAQRITTVTPELLMLINSLPSRTYRDSAEIAIALGELKSGKRPRSQARMIKLEQPSKKGGRNAIKSPFISAARIASLLKGIDFPKSKRSIVTYAKKERKPGTEAVISVLRKISDKQYKNMAQVEKEIGKVK
jgi:hypothetical protein